MGREKNYWNPYGSVPFPEGKEIPHTLWSTEAGLPVPWIGVGVAGTDSATWTSPTFDLRPDLRSSQGMKKSGVPIWTTSYLYVQLGNLINPASATEGLRLEYREYCNTTFGEITQAGPNLAVANPGFPNQVSNNPILRVMPRTDITSEVMLGVDQPDSVVLVFAPLSEGYPVRYWKVEILFTYLNGAGPPIFLQAAVY